MNKYILFLRGINVGGRNMKMAEVKACFEKAGFKNVITVLQTGNIILDSLLGKESLRQQTEDILEKTFSYPARLIVKTPSELTDIIAECPYLEKEQEHRYILFCEDNQAAKFTIDCPILDPGTEAIKVTEDTIYWRIVKGQTLDSPFGKFIAKRSKQFLNTNRNINTLDKVLKKSC